MSETVEIIYENDPVLSVHFTKEEIRRIKYIQEIKRKGGNMDEVLFSSGKTDYETPPWLFNKLNNEFHFDVDVCASYKNAKCNFWYGHLTDNVFIDSLTQNWSENFKTAFMNPPYGQAIKPFMRKAVVQAIKGMTVVALIPARTDTIWWFDYVLKATELRFLKGRVKFIGGKYQAAFPSVIAIFKKGVQQAAKRPIVRWVDYGKNK
jgi:site-specific DNA-methyltransferase (adenine-specific)